MKLLTFSLSNEGPKVGGLLKSGHVVNLQRCLSKYLADVEGIERNHEIASALIPDDMMEFIQGGSQSLQGARLAMEYSSQNHREFTEAGILVSESNVIHWPPLRRPGKIICAGMNFREHVREVGAALPESPRGFIKVQSTLVGHKWPVIIERNMKLIDYEVEVAVVIGKKARNIPQEEALDCVFGYSVFNDVTDRAIQQKEAGVTTAAKNFDTFAPMGPYLVTKDEVGSPGDLNLSLKVNGETRQDSNTKYMIFDIPTLISYWSGIMTLDPGDVITTGTPEGIAFTMKPDPMQFYLKPGDIVEAEIRGLGILANPIKER